MYYNPYYFSYYGVNNFNMVNAAPSYIRIFHASPDAPPVDVYANNQLIAKNLAYKNFTKYLPVSPGNYKIEIYPAGQKNKPVLQTEVKVPEYFIGTVAAVNTLENIELLVIPEPPMPIPPCKAFVRFAHLSPNAPNVDVRLPNGMNLFKNVGFKDVTDYIGVNPGRYTVEVYPTGTDKRVLYVPNINFKPNRFYTIYAVGLVGKDPPLQVLIPLDGNSYLKF